MPIRGPRQLYKIADLQVGESSTGTGGRPVVAKIKEPIGHFIFILTRKLCMAWNDPDMTATFGGSGANAGFTYVRRLGGFRHASYKLVAKTQFAITEIVRQGDGTYSTASKNYRSISIGFPKGVSVHEFLSWIGGNAKASEIARIVTPSGKSIPLGPVTT